MPNGCIEPTTDYVQSLSKVMGRTWPTVSKGRSAATEVLEALSNKLSAFISDDVDLVVFGSLARREWTSGSDIDWTMLIDGQVATDHRSLAREIEDQLVEMNMKEPGSEGIFGSMAFSHDIVHHIGGQADSNKNTTQRILLLLESDVIRPIARDPLGPPGDGQGPLERVTRQILNRYLVSDSNFHENEGEQSRIPRFLLNDIVRYWRTMCVDFAYKDWEQGGKKWALRNIKLRTSRKLLFFSGLLTVLSCWKNETLKRKNSKVETQFDYLLRMQTHLTSFARSTPLDIVVWSLSELGLQEETVAFLDHYEKFLALLDDQDLRVHLAGIPEQSVYTDSRFLECRQVSHSIQASLMDVCFDRQTELRDFVREYGVF